MQIFKAVWEGLKRQWYWMRWIVAAAVLVWLVRSNEESLVKLMNRHPDWGLVLLAGGLSLMTVVVVIYRWYLLVSAIGFEVTAREGIRLGFIGLLFNYVGPGSASGDLVKALMLSRHHAERKPAALATVVLDRLIGMIVLFQLAAMATLVPTYLNTVPAFQPIRASFLIGALVGTAVLVVMIIPGTTRWKPVQWLTRLPMLGRVIAALLKDFELYHQRRNVFVYCVLLSVVGHVSTFVIFYLSSLAVNEQSEVPNYASHQQLIPAAELAGVLVPLPGGVGGLEGAGGWLYKVAGSDYGRAVAMVLVYRLVMLAVTLLGASYYFTAREREKVQQLLEEEKQTAEEPIPAEVTE